jgi:hypothetical protein
MLGGHVCVWDDAANSDASNLIQVAYPPASAVAEVLWSPRAATTGADRQPTRCSPVHLLAHPSCAHARPRRMHTRAFISLARPWRLAPFHAACTPSRPVRALVHDMCTNCATPRRRDAHRVWACVQPPVLQARPSPPTPAPSRATPPPVRLSVRARNGAWLEGDALCATLHAELPPCDTEPSVNLVCSPAARSTLAYLHFADIGPDPDRMHSHRCLLARRGFPVPPLSGEGPRTRSVGQ